jgi:hypothetical protein
MTRRNDTGSIGDQAEAEAIRLLELNGWTATNLNELSRNYRLYDLKAQKGDRGLMISVKHARAKRHVRLGNYRVLKDLRDADYMIIFLPVEGGSETDIRSSEYELWVVPGSARHQALSSHLQYYGGDEERACSHPVMIKDKIDRPGGRSTSGAVFNAWRRTYRDAWHLLADS